MRDHSAPCCRRLSSELNPGPVRQQRRLTAAGSSGSGLCREQRLLNDQHNEQMTEAMYVPCLPDSLGSRKSQAHSGSTVSAFGRLGACRNRFPAIRAPKANRQCHVSGSHVGGSEKFPVARTTTPTGHHATHEGGAGASRYLCCTDGRWQGQVARGGGGGGGRALRLLPLKPYILSCRLPWRQSC